MKHVLLAIILVVALPGCDWFSKSHPKMAEVWPVYQVPGKPLLAFPATIKPGVNPELDVMIKNLYDMKSYSESLKITIETHNAAAAAHNNQVRQDLGVGNGK